MSRVVITDHAWPDLDIERAIVEGAGHALIAGPARAGPAEAIERLVAGAEPDAIMTCWAPVSARAIALAPGLKIVARMGVGLDNIAVEAASARGAWVTNVPDYCVEEVSDHALAMVLAWARGIVGFDRSVKAGRWAPAEARLRRVSTLVAGILGYGRIGRRTAAKLAALGATVLVHDPAPGRELGPGVALVPLKRLLDKAEVVILHLPLAPETRHLVNAGFLARMRPGSLLVNVSRGDIVDSEALVAALDSGPLAAAALDVVEGEPAPPSGLVARDDVIVTPHVAFSSDASLAELRERAAGEVVRVLAGEAPHHPCNAPRGIGA